MAESWKAGAQVLGAGLLIAAGVFAPAVAIPATVAAAPFVLQGFLTTLGAAGLNSATKALEERRRRQLGEPAALLGNHDLELLVSHALDRTLLFALEDDFLAGRKKEIRKLAGQIPGYFEAIRETPPEALGDAALPTAVRDLKTDAPLLEADVWADVVEDLAIRAGCTRDIAGVKKELAAHLGAHFQRFVIEVFKEDATGKGPAGGKGWAALELLFWGLMRADMQALGVHLEDLAGNAQKAEDLANGHAEALAALDAKLDQLVRWHGPDAVANDPELRNLLTSMHQDLGRRLDEIADLIGHGLLTPSAFETAYWRKRRQDPGAQQLWSDAGRARLLTGTVVGRNDEIEAFERFLDGGSPWVLHRYGYPGTGKSRLMIALAKQAVELGRRVYFVSSDVHDLKAALRRAATDEPLVLLWDDYRGDHPEALRVFLGLDDLPGPVVKRVITSWPTINPLGEKASEPHYEKEELGQVVPTEVLAGYTRELLPQVSAEDAARIVRLVEGHPQAVLLAAELVLGGTAPRDLPLNLLEDAYDRLIKRAVATPGLAADDVRRALLVLALVGRVDWGRPSQREAFQRAGVSAATLGALAAVDLVVQQDESYAFHLDGFRAHVVHRSLDYTHPSLLSGVPESVAGQAAPLLEEWVDAIWGVCVLATGGANKTDRREPLQTALLDAIAKVRCADDRRALLFSAGLVNATAVEPDPGRRAELAAGIGRVRERHDTAEIALAEAQALMNATVVEPDPGRRAELAAGIGRVRERHDTAEIALAEAQALMNATVVEPDPGRRAELAAGIGRVRERHDTAEIALAEAQALMNATVVEPDPGRRAELAAGIGRVRERHDTAEIALAEAQALHNATVVEPDPGRRAELAAGIGRVRERHDTAEIALAEAQALMNATVVEPDPGRRAELAAGIGRVRERHDTAEIALEQAKALMNATVGEPDPGRRAELAAGIGRVRERHDTAEIALEQAKALMNAANVEQHADRCLAMADRIAAVRETHDTAEIATQEAHTCGFASTRKQDAAWSFDLAERIARLRERYDVKEIALSEAVALFKAMEAETDEGRVVELKERMMTLVERYGLTDGAGDG